MNPHRTTLKDSAHELTQGSGNHTSLLQALMSFDRLKCLQIQTEQLSKKAQKETTQGSGIHASLLQAAMNLNRLKYLQRKSITLKMNPHLTHSPGTHTRFQVLMNLDTFHLQSTLKYAAAICHTAVSVHVKSRSRVTFPHVKRNQNANHSLSGRVLCSLPFGLLA